MTTTSDAVGNGNPGDEGVADDEVEAVSTFNERIWQ
ncbi:hypothetical protein OKW41_006500 [Paraburkholderia sp. UCT70]